MVAPSLVAKEPREALKVTGLPRLMSLAAQRRNDLLQLDLSHCNLPINSGKIVQLCNNFDCISLSHDIIHCVYQFFMGALRGKVRFQITCLPP